MKAPPDLRARYFFQDEQLFEAFLMGMPRDALVKPIRKDSSLRRRFFRGYQITEQTRSRLQIAMAFRKEILDNDSYKLSYYLTTLWMIVHEWLVKQVLTAIHLNMPESGKSEWFREVLPKAVAQCGEE
jgi:hypothetical protein